MIGLSHITVALALTASTKYFLPYFVDSWGFEILTRHGGLGGDFGVELAALDVAVFVEAVAKRIIAIMNFC